ncbi:MAG: aminopeptidase N, partial [Pseudomonadota bacterium]|nr:aminopeptidase N [Pseudomonadota bacterium]
MDIALTPADAEGNPEMADAAVQPQSPPTILREDYAPFAWLVPTTRLEFVLGLEKTRVTATLDVERNPDADPSPTIRLNGDGLELVSLACDGGDCDGYMMDGDDLVVTLPGEKHTLTIVTELDPSNNSQLMGLYASNGMLCTQCEAEGFRRITFFPDRPDVLSTYTVRMDA